jgi:hypothetical protein
MSTMNEFHFSAGWNEAAKEVAKSVDEYIEARKTNPNLDPWEEWLPRYLAELQTPDHTRLVEQLKQVGYDPAIAELL